MNLVRTLRLSMVVAGAVACRSDSVSGPIPGFTYAAAVSQCGPADGPAVAVYLAPNPFESVEPSAPYVRVYVPVGLDQLTGHWWPISDGNTQAAAWFHSDGSNYELASKGYMIVSSVDSNHTIKGSVDIRFPDAGRIKGGFSATWLPHNTLCP
ncbi:MAG TPA: hypothetical protein VEK37_13260 [Gemmatimonadaceae bacterium]|nr:hypothetical protein [Gemmatimonadaceae bacterium]